MFRWMLLRMMLLLWMTSVTLQGGTGYKPQNPNGGAAQMSPRDYGLGQNSNSANMKGNGYPVNKGTGAYGSAQNKPGYGGRPPYGGTGMGMMNQHALKQRGGYGNGNGNGYKAPSYGGYSNLMGAHPQKGVGLGYGAGPAAAKGQGTRPKGQGSISGGYGISAGYTNGGATKAQQGYGGYANGAKQPNTGSSLSNMGYPNGGTKGPKPGYGAKAGPSNGQGAKPNGYGGYANGGAVKQSNTGSFLQNMGYPNGGPKGPKPAYGAKAGYSNGQRAMPNGSSLQNMGYPNGGAKGPKPGYGAKAGPSNGQEAKPNEYGAYPNGGAAKKPNGSSLQNMGYPNGGTKGPNPGSSLQNMGYPNGGTKGPNPGYGAKAGPSNGQGAKPNGYGGYANGGVAKQPNTGSSLQNMGYTNGGTKGPNPGYGAKAGPSNGQGAKPNGYGGYANRGAAKQPNTGSSLQNMGYPNGGAKGPKPGYGGYANGGAARQPNTGSFQNMGYPNGGTKGPKPGYGGYANGGAARQPNTGSFFQNMGYPNGGTKGPKPGYGAKAGPSIGQGAKPGYGVPGHMSEGPYKAANSGYMPVTAGKEGVPSRKGPKGEILSPEASSHLPLTSNTKGVLTLAERVPNTGLLPEQTRDLPPVLQQTKGQNLNAPLQQGKDPNSMGPQPAPKPFMQGPGFYKPSKAYKPPTPVIPQNKASRPAAPAIPQAIPAPESAPIPQTSYPQTSQTAALEQGQVLSQEQTVTPVIPQPITPQGSIFSQVPLVPNAAVPQITPEMQQTKIQSNPALPQMKNPSTTNPDCGPGGRPNGQWVKLPSPGSGYPNGKGEVSSQPGFGAGGYPAHGINNGYKAGYEGYGNKFNKPAGPQGGQPMGFGSKGKAQAKYGIGGLPFGSNRGYQTNPSGQYGNEGQHYGAKPYNPQALGKHGYGSLPYNSQPLLPESVAKSSDFGGLPYNGQPLGYGGDKSSGKYGQKGLHYGGQPLDLRPDAMSGKYGSPESLYNPESLSLSGDAKSAKYGNPAVSYELLGPVTDGQSVEENRSLEVLHQGPEIDGQKSIDQFGDGEVPPHPDTPGAGEANAQSINKYGMGDYTDGRVQPEVVSFPGVPTVGPAPHIPAVTSFDTTLDGSSLAPVSVPDVSAVSEVPFSPTFSQPELPTLKQQPAPPQQVHIQQHLKFHFHPQGNSQTGKEGKYKLNGFFGNKYQG
ncbi:calymmin [Sinocyclocheilus grahami]|uniref:calymmin n=1 Tax=Sinocyclocheilus grahami TaxID=75366 RepID=UPI0007AD568D|nr:PREDICTED: collagen alpha-2(I) chain-like [Sinocyclocheilus grahami]